MRAIFISYRRDDTEGHAGRLFEDLCDRFGKEAVFMDVAGIEPGRDFRRAIEQQVASCGVLLAVIGKNWLTVADAKGKRRLDDPFDFVRLETAGALKRDIPVIPVLVHQAEMPRVEDLPDDLKDLAFRNGVELNHARWASDVQLLIAALMPHVDVAPAVPVALPPPPPERAPARADASSASAERRSPAWLIAPLGVVAAGGIAYVVWDRLASPSPDAQVVAASAPVLASSVPSMASMASVARAPVASAVAPAPAPALVIAPAPAPEPVTASAAPPGAGTTTVAVAAAPALRPSAIVPSPKPHRTDVPVAARSPSPSPGPRAAPAAPMSTAAAPAAIVQPAPATIARAPASPPPAAAPEIVAAMRDAAASDFYGAPGAGSMPARTIAISADTKFVNVTGGETIRFQVGTRSFVWTFNGTRSSFDLARVAPAALLDHKITTYVAPDPMHPKK